jgi:3-oxoacyl-[acyl-carrier-protein] synthase-1
MTRAVHIVALCAQTPVGLTPETAAAAVRGRISRIEEHPFLVDPVGEPLAGAWVPNLDPDLLGWRRIMLLATTTLSQLGDRLDSSILSTMGRGSLLLGLPEHRPGWTSRESAATLSALADVELQGARGLAVEEVARGHAAAVYGLAMASQRIMSGVLDWSIVGGVDSYFDADTLAWLTQHRQLSTSQTRSSFIPGEAAGSWSWPAPMSSRASACRLSARSSGRASPMSKR